MVNGDPVILVVVVRTVVARPEETSQVCGVVGLWNRADCDAVA